MSVARITEIKSSSKKSFEDAIAHGRVAATGRVCLTREEQALAICRRSLLVRQAMHPLHR